MTLELEIRRHEEAARAEGEAQGRIQNARNLIKAGLLNLASVRSSGLYTEQELAAIAAP